jgi:anti-sigma regulatory factor (Ser/Thr protein kinase)
MPRPSQILDLRADPAELRLMRAFVSHWAERCGLSTAETFDACLVATEAVTNAIRHSGADEHPIRVACRLEGGQLLIDVNDRGTFRAGPRESGTNGGRGLLLIRELSEEFDLLPGAGGTELRMRLGVQESQAI